MRERSHERNNAPTETGVPELEKCLIKFTRLTGASEIKKRRVVPVGAVALDVLRSPAFAKKKNAAGRSRPSATLQAVGGDTVERGLVSLDLLIDTPK